MMYSFNSNRGPVFSGAVGASGGSSGSSGGVGMQDQNAMDAWGQQMLEQEKNEQDEASIAKDALNNMTTF